MRRGGSGRGGEGEAKSRVLACGVFHMIERGLGAQNSPIVYVTVECSFGHFAWRFGSSALWSRH